MQGADRLLAVLDRLTYSLSVRKERVELRWTTNPLTTAVREEVFMIAA